MSVQSGTHGPAPESLLPVVALVASAGGLEALGIVLEALPAALPAAVLVMQHLEPGRHSLLPVLLSSRTALPVEEARPGARLRAGRVYVAPADLHLTVAADRTLSLSHTQRVHFSRPSADVLLGSLADAIGPRGIAVVLTGRGSDGAAGALLVREQGGTVIAQDRASSREFGMPGAAAGNGSASLVVPLEQVAPCIVTLLASLESPSE